MAAALATLSLTGVAGCSNSTQDVPTPTGELPAATPTAPGPEDVGTNVDESVRTSEAYWDSYFASKGSTFVPVQEVIPYDKEEDGDCAGQPFTLNNAFFCPDGDFIAYDVNFVSDQYEQIGDVFVFYLIGHEYAHAVQARLDISHALTIAHELQADCMAGAYLGDSVRQGQLAVEDGDIEELLTSLALVGDQPGVKWYEEGAHGSAQDRTEALRKGSKGTADGGSSLEACF